MDGAPVEKYGVPQQSKQVRKPGYAHRHRMGPVSLFTFRVPEEINAVKWCVQRSEGCCTHLLQEEQVKERVGCARALERWRRWFERSCREMGLH